MLKREKLGFNPSTVVVFSALLLAFLYWCAASLPENFTSRSTMTVVELVLRLTYMRPVAAMAMLGPYYQMLWTRAVIDFYARALSPWSLNDPDLTIYNGHMGGVSVRIYEPKLMALRANDGAIVFIHGGGFVVGEVAGYDLIVRDLARKSRMLTISVDYRRAPEHPYPIPINDCEAVVRSLLTHSHNHLRINPAKVVLVGDSAGGNLVAVLTQRLRDVQGTLPKIRSHVLLYPLLQFHDFQLSSYQRYYREYDNTALLDPRSIARSFLMYTGARHSADVVEKMILNKHSGIPLLSQYSHRSSHSLLPDEFTTNAGYYERPSDNDDHVDHDLMSHLTEHHIINADVSPLLGNLNMLPPAMIVTCDYDILRDEGFLYARALTEHNVTVDYRHYEGSFHALLNFHTKIPLAQTILADVVAYIRRTTDDELS